MFGGPVLREASETLGALGGPVLCEALGTSDACEAPGCLGAEKTLRRRCKTTQKAQGLQNSAHTAGFLLVNLDFSGFWTKIL